MLHILVDPTVFRYGRCGLTRYYAAVCEGLARQQVHLSIPLLSSNSDFKPGIARWTDPLRRIPKLGGLLDTLSERWFHHLVRRGDYDCILFTSPSFDAGFLRHNPSARFLMIVHDLMSCVTAPDGLYDAAGPGMVALMYLANRASRVVCISHDTRRALLSHGLVQADRTAVVLTGNLLAASQPQEQTVPLPRRFLLFVGERSGRKGFYSLIRILPEILRAAPDLHLVCTGTLREAETDYIARHIPLDRVHAIPANDGVLVTLYRRALCLVYPSLYEGFGLPVIEAMHYGCPVITSRCGALAEVAGDAAILIDPNQPEQMRDAILRLVSDPAWTERCSKAGQTHASGFAVDRMMQSLRAELERATEPPHHETTLDYSVV
jgi:glycosyltransferase involved in cell wall biosynthesis